MARNTICQEDFFPEEAGEEQDGPSGLGFLWVLFTQVQKPFPSEGEVKANSGLGRSKCLVKAGRRDCPAYLAPHLPPAPVQGLGGPIAP